MSKSMLKYFKQVNFLLATFFIAGCSSLGVVHNKPKKLTAPRPENYSVGLGSTQPHDETLLILSFSGGGTRAAALAYGVMKELNETNVVVKGKKRNVLDGVDVISSVSGGSFTSAYYGLYGKDIFNDFESDFLRQDFQSRLIKGMFFSPKQWFSDTGRSEVASKYYQKKLFKGKTFADMVRNDAPMILINATDLTYGVRFTFVQEYFNLLGSDINSFPIASAVTASSAVPVVFDPVVVENYDLYDPYEDPWTFDITNFHKQKSPHLEMIARGVESYKDKVNHKYIHFVDGGITDNLGLRAIYDIVELAGGLKTIHERYSVQIPKRIVVISVNATTSQNSSMDRTRAQPTIAETMSAVTSMLMQRYDTETIALLESSLKRWAKDISTPEHPVNSHFLQIRFDSVEDEEQRNLLNTTPTSFDLTDEQVDLLIKTGRELLRNNPEFKKLLKEVSDK